MKKFFYTLIAFIVISLTVNAQKSFNIQAGYSKINGLIGVESEVFHFSISAGFMPMTLPISGDFVPAYSATVSYYLMTCDKSSPYITFGVSSAGNRDDDVVTPTNNLLGGYRYNINDDWYGKAGLGVGWCAISKNFEGEFTIGYRIHWN